MTYAKSAILKILSGGNQYANGARPARFWWMFVDNKLLSVRIRVLEKVLGLDRLARVSISFWKSFMKWHFVAAEIAADGPGQLNRTVPQVLGAHNFENTF